MEQRNESPVGDGVWGNVIRRGSGMVSYERVEEIISDLEGRYGPMEEYYTEEATTPTLALAWALFLIRKRQECGISPAEEKMLRELMLFVLEYITSAVHYWEVWHGYVKDKRAYRDFAEILLETPEEFDRLIMEYEDELYDRLGDLTLATDEEIKEELLDILMNEYDEAGPMGFMKAITDRVHEYMERVKSKARKVLAIPEAFTTSELILFFDEAVDLQHVGGDLLSPPYSTINVVLARELAEDKLEEVCPNE